LNNKTKRLIIIILDVAIGIVVELWASNTYPEHKTLFTVLFFTLLSIRMGFDWLISTIEDKFYELHLNALLSELQANLEIQKEIKTKMKIAIENNDFESYRNYLKIKK